MRRIQKVFRRSIVLDVVLYIILGITGYLSVPYNVPPLIIDRISIFSNDFLMIIGRLGIAITLMLTLPANYNAFRLSMLEQIYGNTEVTNQR
jgi:amino acid permease